MKKSCFEGRFCSKGGIKKDCHSQFCRAQHLGIFRILSSYAKKEKSLCDNDTYVEDPRLQASGMTALCNGAFTLIELLVVVLIIGILAAVAVPQYQKVVERSKATEAMSMLSSIAKAYQVHYLADGQYATTFEELDVDIPFTGKTEFLSMAEGVRRTGDTKSNQDWSFQIERTPTGYRNLFASRIDGKYKGAGFIISFDNPSHNAEKQIRCFERISEAEILFDTDLPQGAYCERVMQATKNRENVYGRYYRLP